MDVSDIDVFSISSLYFYYHHCEYIYICMYVCMYVRTYVCMYVCITDIYITHMCGK